MTIKIQTRIASALVILAMPMAHAQNPSSPGQTGNEKQTSATLSPRQILASQRLALAEINKKYEPAFKHADALFQAGNWDEAIAGFQEAIAIQPAVSLAYLKLASAYTAKGQYDKAVDTYRTLFYDVPGKNWSSGCQSDSTELMRFAVVLLRTGQRDEALKVYQQGYHYLPTDRGPLPPAFLSLNFSDADFMAAAYTSMGLYQMACGIAADAPGSLDRAIALQPNLAVAYFYRAKIRKFRPEQTSEAIEDFKRAAELDRGNIRPFLKRELTGGCGLFLDAVQKTDLGKS